MSMSMQGVRRQRDETLLDGSDIFDQGMEVRFQGGRRSSKGSGDALPEVREGVVVLVG